LIFVNSEREKKIAMTAKERRLSELKASISEVTPAQAFAMQAQGAALIDVREGEEIVRGSPFTRTALGADTWNCASRRRYPTCSSHW